jgi:hypothetical protein
MIIGLSGLARQGKDTVGSILTSILGYDTYSLASPIKKITGAFLGWHQDEMFEISRGEDQLCVITNATYEKSREVMQEVGFYSAVVEAGVEHLFDTKEALMKTMGFDDYLFSIPPRRVWQHFGTEVGRKLVKDSIWLDLVPTGSDNLVITDVRFENESEFLRDKGGIIVHVFRDNKVRSVGGIENHQSEAGIEKHPKDYVLMNTGSLDDLQDKVKFMLKELSIEP